MTEYRVKGETGSGDITVFTEWFDDTKPKVQGIEIGLRLKGWVNTEIEEKEW